MEFQSLVSFEYWTFIAQILNLFIQIWLFKKFLFKPVKKIIEKRQAEVDSLYKEAESARLDAAASKESYESHMKNAREEALEITKRAEASAKERERSIIKAAEVQANALLEKAEKDIELDRTRAMNEAKSEISGLALDIAEKIVKKKIDAEENDALIGEFLNEFGEQ